MSYATAMRGAISRGGFGGGMFLRGLGTVRARAP